MLWGFVQIKLNNVLDKQIASTMVRSLSLNLIMIFTIVHYILLKRDVRSFLRMIEAGTFLVAIIVVILSIQTITTGRLGGGTEINANMFAMLCVYGFILQLYLYKSDSCHNKYLHIFKLFLYISFILLTGSRKGLLMIVLSLIIIQLLQGKRNIINKLLGLSAIALILYLLIMKVDFLYNIIGVRVDNLLELIITGETSEGSLNTRNFLIEKGWYYISQKPVIGYGYDCYKVISGIDGDGYTRGVGLYSHNNYIELLFGGGIIALILYYIPIIGLLISLYKNINTHSCITYLLAILVSKLAVEYAYVSYYSRIDAYIIAIILGCLLLSKKTSIEDKHILYNL